MILVIIGFFLFYLEVLEPFEVSVRFVAFSTLELRDIAEVDRMLERLITFVTGGTLPGVLVAKIDWMLEDSVRRESCYSARCPVDRCMTKVTIVPNHFSLAAKVLTVVTSEATLSV